MSIYLFCEGKTEKNVVRKFATLANPDIKGQGKAQVNKKIKSDLGPLLSIPKPLRTLVMRDVDEGETAESIVQSVSGAVETMLNERDFPMAERFQSHDDYPNVYLLTLTEPDLRLALHLAAYKWDETFVNATIDDYVLALALREATAESFLKKNKWREINPEQLVRKVTEHIPALLRENGIRLREARDYVRLYAAIIQTHLFPATFASKALAHARDEDIKGVFASLLAALDFLEGGSQ